MRLYTEKLHVHVCTMHPCTHAHIHTLNTCTHTHTHTHTQVDYAAADSPQASSPREPGRGEQESTCAPSEDEETAPGRESLRGGGGGGGGGRPEDLKDDTAAGESGQRLPRHLLDAHSHGGEAARGHKGSVEEGSDAGLLGSLPVIE